MLNWTVPQRHDYFRTEYAYHHRYPGETPGAVSVAAVGLCNNFILASLLSKNSYPSGAS